ncbi:unnamed protein product [Callosobruchus maculatus]|uniref:dihydrofolate reductase n=1 Tax=Callosobruchus maculatus TaxID=64391 RepID=A0A653CAZ6_CALMS|nr:unnamed protein product [Callosobruchus maculatus]
MLPKLNLIAAACENMGIGHNNNLPWRLKTEMDYFTRMTSKTKHQDKKNVVIMGRKTWDSIPKKFKPLNNRINFILSRSDLVLSEYKDVYSFKSLADAINKLNEHNFKNLYENIWVIGGSHIYDECMKSEYFYRLYLTRIHKAFECDTFFPALPEGLKEVSDEDVPKEVQNEKGIDFTYHVYENVNFKD